MSRPRRLALLFGGRSVEHEVSVDSARAVSNAMRDTGLECVPIGVTGDGRWLPPDVSQAILASDVARVESSAEGDDDSRIVLEPGSADLVCLRPGCEPQRVPIDCVFPLIHGWGGEDGRIQGALDLAGIPCVGPGVLGSAAAMDKIVARQLFDAQGLPGVRWVAVGRDAAGALPDPRPIATAIGFPAFVKPANGGSSIGITRVDAIDQLPGALDRAFACDARVIVEQGIDAREVECAVLGNECPEASVLGEIVPSREFYDYAAKYIDGTSELIIPAELDEQVTEAVRAHALTAFRCLGLSGLARVDFLIDRGNGQVYLNEVNTLPGFTAISMFPKLWQATGLAFSGLIERLVDLAEERSEAESGRRSVWKSDD